MAVRLKILVLTSAMILLSACTEVRAWQKGDLAREEMKFEPNPAYSKYAQHVYASKEAGAGGFGIGGGGCGCK